MLTEGILTKVGTPATSGLPTRAGTPEIFFAFADSQNLSQQIKKKLALQIANPRSVTFAEG